MIIIVGTILLIIVLIQVVILVIEKSRKNHGYNQTIYLEGGRAAGDSKGLLMHRQLLQGASEYSDTIVRGKSVVTSSFSSVHIRLYQYYTGRCYDAYLENSLQIGRVPSATGVPSLIIEDPMVSQKHCILFRKGDQILIQDLESKNHTFVNGCRTEGCTLLNHGDCISLGQSQYQFQCYYQE